MTLSENGVQYGTVPQLATLVAKKWSKSLDIEGLVRLVPYLQTNPYDTLWHQIWLDHWST